MRCDLCEKEIKTNIAPTLLERLEIEGAILCFDCWDELKIEKGIKVVRV